MPCCFGGFISFPLRGFIFLQALVSRVAPFFFVLTDMAVVRQLYQFSLRFFTSVFFSSLKSYSKSSSQGSSPVCLLHRRWITWIDLGACCKSTSLFYCIDTLSWPFHNVFYIFISICICICSLFIQSRPGSWVRLHGELDSPPFPPISQICYPILIHLCLSLPRQRRMYQGMPLALSSSGCTSRPSCIKRRRARCSNLTSFLSRSC